MMIRPYRDADLPHVVQLFTDSVHQLAAPYYDDAQRRAWAPATPDLAAWRTRLRTPALVAEEAGLLGFLIHDGAGYVEYLYVAPSAARRGVARSLFGAALAGWAPGTRAHTEASLAARPFFESQGFQVIEQQHVERGGQVFTRFRMERAPGATGCD